MRVTLQTICLTGLTGGIAGAVFAAMHPHQWLFPRDVGSGKLWPYFFDGALGGVIGGGSTSLFGLIQRRLKRNKEQP